MKDATWIQTPIQKGQGGRNGKADYATDPDSYDPIFAFHYEILGGLDALPNYSSSEKMENNIPNKCSMLQCPLRVVSGPSEAYQLSGRYRG